MKVFILILFVLLHGICYGQLVFEVNQSNSSNGVYPCISADSNWNTPNLLSDGNWFSDTLRITNDGAIGSACAALNNNATGNFALSYRTGCELRQTLLNIQNSGATGAVIIDTISGRPLPFPNDSIDSLITIPFVIISNDIGEQLFNEITAFTTVIVSFGDKTGTSTTEVGIYKESSWWSMYGCFPFESLSLQDTLWGSWVYNHGTDTASNLQLRFYFELNNSTINYYDEVNSATFNIPPLDSIYIPLLLSYNHTQWTTFDNDTMKYGYQILNAIDNDTLDNKIENYIISTYDILSHSYQREYQLQNTKDYTIKLGGFVDVYQRYEVIDYDVWGYLNFILNIPLDTLGSNISTDLLVLNGDSINDVRQIPSSSFLDFTSLNMNSYTIVPFSECIDLDYLTMSNPTNYFNIIFNYLYMINSPGVLFTSDMYHDLRYESDSTFLAFIDQGNPTVLIPFDARLTPTHYVQVIHSEGPFCAGSLPENNITVSISPNPSSDKLNISSNSRINEVKIIDLSGKIMTSKKMSAYSENINVNSLTEGLYILLIEMENGEKVQKKFVKL
ncbi:MAG: T9SS type A sorting domain-containing protein [Fluviicola sp.]|nr:T9SS type A sorting domain-containing protein [Fluviicola sp.]